MENGQENYQTPKKTILEHDISKTIYQRWLMRIIERADGAKIKAESPSGHVEGF